MAHATEAVGAGIGAHVDVHIAAGEEVEGHAAVSVLEVVHHEVEVQEDGGREAVAVLGGVAVLELTVYGELVEPGHEVFHVVDNGGDVMEAAIDLLEFLSGGVTISDEVSEVGGPLHPFFIRK